jgi:hypothetical protein
MPDERMHEDADLKTLLQALPLQAPPRSAWPRLQRELPGRGRTVPRWSRWLAAAAALGTFALLPGWLDGPVDSPQQVASASTAYTPAVVSADDATLIALMQESSQLERWIALSQVSAVDSAPSASLGAALSGRVQQIDALLARADLDAAAQVPLWQERVLRMRQLAQIEGTQMLLAARGDSDAGLPVLTF